ncbi:MAG: biotin--[acetyl-CoA-carboxylase] ligase [Desulfurococcaceae archaeon]
MSQNLLEYDKLFMLKMELLRVLSTKDNAFIPELAGELGITELEVIDLIRELRENYLITQEKMSISWAPGDNPAKIKPWGWNYVYKQIVGSTMVSAKHYAPWTIIIAEHQTKSYGRHGKRWISNIGGLWMTMKLEVEPRVAQMLPVTIPVLLCNYLKDRLGVKAGIKWPNDIVVNEKKLAGFLIEGEVLLSKVIVYLGIGINVNNHISIEVATSLKSILGRLIPRNSIIAYIAGRVGRIEDYVKEYNRLQMQYLDLLETLGRKVKIYTKSGEYIGIARNVTETGDIVIETPTGSLRFNSGEVIELRHVD